MKVFECSTYFDITATGVRSHYKQSRIPFTDDTGQLIADQGQWHYSRNQQRNWETINQIISLRTLPTNIAFPTCGVDNERKIWVFEFELEFPESVELSQSPVGAFLKDCVDVPMLTGLNETYMSDIVLKPNENIFFTVKNGK